MKTKLLLLRIVCCIGLGCFLFGCEQQNTLNEQLVFSGRVVDRTGNIPLSDITVRITNGSTIGVSMVTAKDGMFSLSVNLSNIDDSYYLELLDNSGNSKKGQLRGFGSGGYDFGDIPFVEVLPKVETLAVTNLTSHSFRISCQLTSQGISPVIIRGLCWSTSDPTIDDNVVEAGKGEGIYECIVESADINIENTNYYVRAFATNAQGTAYGSMLKIDANMLGYFNLTTMQYGGYTYHIHPDLGKMQWEQGNSACENLSAYGYDDWFLPNKEEMMAIAENTNVVNTEYEYWTSSKEYGSSWAAYVGHYSRGWAVGGTSNPSNSRHVVPVRKD